MSQCKDCRFYKMTYDGPYCHKNPRPMPVSPINSKDCFEEPAPTAEDLGKSVAKEIVKQVSDNIEKPKRRGGRPRAHQNYVDENGVTMKWCRMCQQYKPLDEFYRKSGTPDGHAYECKSCRTDHQRKKREEKRQNQPEKVVRKRTEKKPEEKPVLGWISKDRKVTDTYVKVPVMNRSGEVETIVKYRPGDEYVTIIIRTSDEK